MDELKAMITLLQGINPWSVCLRILLATLIGGIIGMDRGKHGRAAGARTHILVCLGGCLTTLLGFYTAQCLHFNNDPLRMGAQVVSGIGFLGVGTIMIRNHSQVTGLTTAAGLWTTACIGLVVGAGLYGVAILSFLTVLFTFTLLSRLERRLIGRDTGAYYIEMIGIQEAKAFYNRMYQKISAVDIVPAKSGLPDHVGLEFIIEDPKLRKGIFEELQQREDVVIALPHHP